MLTYKIISKEDNIITYSYFPHGKDIKVEGGRIKLNLNNYRCIIESVAQLDELEDISNEEKSEIIKHINQLREEEGYPLITEEEEKNLFIPYKFAGILINEILEQANKGELKDKGLII